VVADEEMRKAISITVITALSIVTWSGVFARSRATMPAVPSISDEAMEQAKTMLVMIDCKFDGNVSFGAGVIFGISNDRLLIVTDRHVLFSDDDMPADDIKVKFFWSPGESMKAEIANNDSTLDLAVLYVLGTQTFRKDMSSLPFRCLGEPEDCKKGDEIYLLGYAGHAGWYSSSGLERMVKVQRQVLDFQSVDLRSGYSGGALMDESGRIVGMIRTREGPNGQAVRIDAIIGKLSEWGYNVKLAVRPKVEPPSFTMTVDGVGIEMVLVPSGKFLMGSPVGIGGKDEHPQHEVTLSTFYIGKYEVTQLQWRAVVQLPKVKIDLSPNPSHFKGDNLPVEQVSWEEAVEFCARLAKRTERMYRLPNEAEWEYASRSGITGPGAGDLKSTAWYADNSDKRTHPVGSKQPNSFGLYDMFGNVCEWCADWYLERYYSISRPADPRGPNSGLNRTRRGGSWQDPALFLRSARRDFKNSGFQGNNLGFRVVMTYN
jgi:formylglycine-generating enzyme required for sulfatase activity